MKLLLDENLSRRIVPFLQGVFPGSSQVVLEGLERADDLTLWRFAKTNGFVIVTNDSDFHELSLLLGAPPKVIWLQTGNVSKLTVMQLLLDHADDIKSQLNASEANCLVITLP